MDKKNNLKNFIGIFLIIQMFIVNIIVPVQVVSADDTSNSVTYSDEDKFYTFANKTETYEPGYVKLDIKSNKLYISGGQGSEESYTITISKNNKDIDTKKGKFEVSRTPQFAFDLSSYEDSQYEVSVWSNNSYDNLNRLSQYRIVKDNGEVFFYKDFSYKLAKNLENTLIYINDKYEGECTDTTYLGSYYDMIKQKTSEIVKPYYNDYQNVKLIYEWISDNCWYDFYNGQVVDNYAAFMIQNGYGTCYGYASLFTAMCRCAGIPCITITGGSLVSGPFMENEPENHYETDSVGVGPHAWNGYCINGQWKYCDATWDNHNQHDGETGKTTYNKTKNEWFNLTLEYISLRHIFQSIDQQNFNDYGNYNLTYMNERLLISQYKGNKKELELCDFGDLHSGLGRGAFWSNSFIECIAIPENVNFDTLSTECICNCPNLKRLIVPPTVTNIEDYAIGGCPNVIVYCKSGSAIEEYCKKNNIMTYTYDERVKYSSIIEGNSDFESNSYDGGISGTEGQGKRIEGLKASLESNNKSGDILYRAYINGTGWTDWQSNGAEIKASGKDIEAMQMKLSGDLSNEFDLYYRAHVRYDGWLGWTKDSEVAGELGYGSAIEGYEVRLVRKGDKVQGITDSTAQANKIKNYTVTFCDEQGKVINTQTVLYGQDAKLPTNTYKDGYVFTGWQGSYQNITSDRKVVAKYTKSATIKSYQFSSEKVVVNSPVTFKVQLENATEDTSCKFIAQIGNSCKSIAMNRISSDTWIIPWIPDMAGTYKISLEISQGNNSTLNSNYVCNYDVLKEFKIDSVDINGGKPVYSDEEAYLKINTNLTNGVKYEVRWYNSYRIVKDIETTDNIIKWTPNNISNDSRYTIEVLATDANGNEDRYMESVNIQEKFKIDSVDINGGKPVYSDEEAYLKINTNLTNGVKYEVRWYNSYRIVKDIETTDNIIKWTPNNISNDSRYTIEVLATDANGNEDRYMESVNIATVNKVTIYYKGFNNPNIHYVAGYDVSKTWKTVAMQPNTDVDGYNYAVTLDFGEESGMIACFNGYESNGAFNWDSNGQLNYKFGTGYYTYSNGNITAIQKPVKELKITNIKSSHQSPVQQYTSTIFETETLDAQGDLQYKYVCTNPDGTTSTLRNYSSYNKIEWTPGTPGDYKITVYVTDGQTEVSKSVNYKVTEFKDVNVSSLTSSLGTEFGKGKTTKISMTASNGYSTLYNYSIKVNGKEILNSVNDTSADFTPSEAGTYKVVATVTDARNVQATKEMTLNVKDVTSNMVTIYYKGFNNPNIHYVAGYDVSKTWKTVAMQPNTDVDGYNYAVTLDLGEESGMIACFNGYESNGAFNWDSNGQLNYKFGTGYYTYSNGTITAIEKPSNELRITSIEHDGGDVLKNNSSVNFKINVAGGKAPYTYDLYTYQYGSGAIWNILRSSSLNEGTWIPNYSKDWMITANVKDAEGNMATKTITVKSDDITDNFMTIYYKASKATNIYYQIGDGEWEKGKNGLGQPMEVASDKPGYYKKVINLGSETRLTACFNDGNYWDNTMSDGTRDYHFNQGPGTYYVEDRTITKK